jgi:hypothetical protein
MTQVIMFSKKRKSLQYYILLHGHFLELTEHTKCFGVTLNKTHKFKAHTQLVHNMALKV